jgi:TPR repeat protein
MTSENEKSQSIPGARRKWIVLLVVAMVIGAVGLYLTLTNEKALDRLVSRQIDIFFRSSVEIILVATFALGVLLWRSRRDAYAFIKSSIENTAVIARSNRVLSLRYFSVGLIASIIGALAGYLIGSNKMLDDSMWRAQSGTTESHEIHKLRADAEGGDAVAQTSFGYRYAAGKGVLKNAAEAVKWYRRAADQGDAVAQNALGVSFATGEGVPENDAEAVNWFRRAADQGYAGGQYNLGLTYEKGEGVPKDYAEAVKWYRRAADQGNAEAQTNLGGKYAEGKGVPRSDTEAYFWWNLAASKGIELAKNNRDYYEVNRLTLEQIAEAQRRSAAWKPKKE